MENHIPKTIPKLWTTTFRYQSWKQETILWIYHVNVCPVLSPEKGPNVDPGY